MTIDQADAILALTDITIIVHLRFAFDTGTILRLDNYGMINIFDDGRYYIQGENAEELTVLFGKVEQPWDPDSWDGQIPASRASPPILPLS